MRRVFDDEQYNVLSEKISDVLYDLSLSPEIVQEYSNGDYRSSRTEIMAYVVAHVDAIKFGRNVNTTGIGNNAAFDVIYTGNPKEEQVFGVIHLTNDMFGRHVCWVSDIDDGRRTEMVKI